MKIFDFSEEIINKVIEELENAEEYIKIAIFQIHHEGIFDVIEEKLSQDIDVEIITLPYDSIYDNVRNEVETRLKSLIKNGLKLYFCEWNVGNPERTTTAVGRWYLFHGKFIVTDKSAIALSSNFIQTAELDAMLIYRLENEKIIDFNNKFNKLKELFITGYGGYKGNVRSKIIETGINNVEDVFDLPKVISPGIHDRTWIQHYPSQICPKDVEIEEKLYLTPFNCRGRVFLHSILDEAEEFVYLSTESFTDKDLPTFLKKIKLKGIDIKILTGYKSMDFTDRIQKFMKELLAIGVELKTPSTEIHGKLWITDKLVSVNSVNLNKINLGFSKTKKYWRENTETIDVCRDEEIIRLAKEKYLNIFNVAIPVKDKFAEKNISYISSFFNKTFGTSISKEAKMIFSKLEIGGEIKNNEVLVDLAKLAVEITKEKGENRITKKILEEAMVVLDIS